MKYSSHAEYIRPDGIEVPSATTLLKIINKPSLSKWANYLGFKHLNVDAVLDDYSRFGTLVHEMINSFLNNGIYIYIHMGNLCCPVTW